MRVDSRTMSALARLALACALIAVAPVGAESSSDEARDWSVDVGFLNFPTSGSPEAQRHFQRGVAILHSFGYEQAIEEFRAAQELEPDFAMAYWGEALSYNHIFRDELDLDSPREALARLGETHLIRLAKAPTQREKDFLSAVEVHFGESELGEDTDARRIAYMEAMREMYETYPDDDEVAAFYAVALIAARRPLHDDTYRVSMEAGAIALQLFDRNPDHPGAAHYIIHAFDDPVHAPLALPAADRFAEIAGAVSHARHMPSHIFIQRGMWDRVSRSNDSAYEVARELWEPGGSVADMTHSNDWGHYGDLQRADWERAAERMAIMDEIVEMAADLGEYERRFPERAADWMWARQVIESERWETREVDDETSADVAFASGYAAVELGRSEIARSARKRLDDIVDADDNKRDRVMRDMLVAKMELARGRERKALEALDAAVAGADSMGPPAGTPSTVKPAHELYGEILLELGRPEAAISRFEEGLLLMPNRRLSMRGLAQAHQEAGHEERAKELRGELETAAAK